MTPQEEHDMLVEKIARAKADIEQFKLSGIQGGKLETMSLYQEYLEDELKMLEVKLRDNRS